MTETILGKITSVYFGKKEGRFGLWLTLSGSWSVQTQYTCWDREDITVTEYTKWTEQDRNQEITKIIRKISELLHQAKINEVSKLLNIPIEMTTKDNQLDTWRILEEVL